MSFAATQAAAAPGPVLFRLTISGTANQEWMWTAAPTQNGSCTRTVKSEGIRSVRFSTRRAVVVRLRDGRVLPADVRNLRGTVTLAGANTTDETCPGSPSSSVIADCAQTRRAFTRGRVHIASTRRGFITVGAARGVRVATADCPREPGQVIRRPLGPTLSTLRLPPQALYEQRVARITMRASRTGRTVYGSPESGNLQERVEWRLTFVRVKR